jgi:tRNA threonylcarbamoyladenosine biosynthesis protein TsaB
MTVLGVDTSQPFCSIAVLEDGCLIGETRLHSPLPFSSHLLPSIESLTANLGVDIKDIGLFAVAAGPGSFTGVRIGLSSVMGLAAPDQKPVAGISTLRAMAWAHRGQDILVAPLISTARGLLYAGLYGAGDERMQPVRKDRIETPRRFLDALPAGKVLFCGSGSDQYQDLIRDALGGRALFRQAGPYLAAAVAFLGLQDQRSGLDLSLEKLTPNYLRPSDAEFKFIRDQKKYK